MLSRPILRLPEVGSGQPASVGDRAGRMELRPRRKLWNLRRLLINSNRTSRTSDPIVIERGSSHGHCLVSVIMPKEIDRLDSTDSWMDICSIPK